MNSGYYLPFSNGYKLAWIWWVTLLAFQQVLYYENNLQMNFYLMVMLIIAAVWFYFLIRQRRFFASKHHLYFTRDFRLNMVNLDLSYITAVKLTRRTFRFSYAGKEYQFLIFGKSNLLLQELLKENDVHYTLSTVKRTQKI